MNKAQFFSKKFEVKQRTLNYIDSKSGEQYKFFVAIKSAGSEARKQAKRYIIKQGYCDETATWVDCDSLFNYISNIEIVGKKLVCDNQIVGFSLSDNKYTIATVIEPISIEKSVEVNGGMYLPELEKVIKKLLEILKNIVPYIVSKKNEAIPQKKKVVRDGKTKVILDCPPNYKLEGRRCIKMSASELRDRKLAAKKAARKRKTKKTQILRKRKLSLRKRDNIVRR